MAGLSRALHLTVAALLVFFRLNCTLRGVSQQETAGGRTGAQLLGEISAEFCLLVTE